MKAITIPVEEITVIPEFHRSQSDKVQDDILRRSIEHAGVQQPLVVLEHQNKWLLVKGSRRLKIAKAIGLPKVPAVVDHVPEGQDAIAYAKRIRFILDEHRQDLLPSQKADLVVRLKEMFTMNNVQVAAYLGIDQDSVTNWLAVKRYVAPVVEALDGGQLTMQAARVFDGMTDEGQNLIWEAHAEELRENAGGKQHKAIRAQYPPEDYPDLYRDPERIAGRLNRSKTTRQAKPRPTLTTDEKRRLMSSVEMREIEIRESKVEEKQLKAEIHAATPIVHAILRNDELSKLVPDEMKTELERFAEVY